jgi:hypothetical protein
MICGWAGKIIKMGGKVQKVRWPRSERWVAKIKEIDV